MGFMTTALIGLAKGALTSVVGPFVQEAREASLNAAQDTLRGAIAGRMSIEEWADIVIDGVGSVKERAITEGNLRFVGGKLKFAPSEEGSGLVNISFQLYFLDEMEHWQKAEADTDVPASKFTSEALEEIESKKEIIYEVE